MRSLEELTLYANGLLEEPEEAAVKAHVESCEACGTELRRLHTERELLLQAAAVDSAAGAPPSLLSRRPRRTRAGFLMTGLAAAVLLGVLPWLLSHPTTSVGPEGLAPLARSSGEDLDRLIGELKSPSALRREIAAVALKAYGSSALEKLEKANADPALLDACRGITPADRALMKKLGELRITMDIQKAPLTAVMDYLREVSKLSFHISGVDNPDEQFTTAKFENKPLDGLLRQVLEPLSLSYEVRNGVVMVTTQDQLKNQAELRATPLAPIRLPLQEAAVRRSILALGSDVLAERDKATAALLRIGLSSEPLLWPAIDSASAEVRGRASDILRRLYGPPWAARLDESSRRLEEQKPTMDFENALTSEILGSLGDSVGLPILLVTESVDLDRKVTFKTKDLVAKNSLKLLLSQFNLDYVTVDGAILIVVPSSSIFRTPPSPLWKSPEEASRIEALLHKVAAGDPVDVLSSFRTQDLGALLQAGKALEGPAAGRCRRAAALVAENAHLWAIDQGSGVDLQELTPAQKAILAREGKATGPETLVAFLERLGLKHSLKSPVDLQVRAYGPAPKVGVLLKSILRPQGYDFYMEGETLVIDKSAAVRAAVDK